MNKPQRMCAICHEHNCKEDMYRFVIIDNRLVYDSSNKINARGLYICKNNNCLDNVYKCKLLNKIFKKKVSNEDYDLFIKQITK